VKNGSNRTIQYRDYVAGWLDSSIHDFLPHIPRTSTKLKFALITSLDSDLFPAKLLDKSPELKAIATKAQKLGDGFIVPTSLILKVNDEVFHGFDEVWFFPSDKISPKPKTAGLVGPNRADQTKLDKLGSWIAANECSLGLGDGDGLNIVVNARGLAACLLACSLSQSQPLTGGEEEEEALKCAV
jgi:hypothetical protein